MNWVESEYAQDSFVLNNNGPRVTLARLAEALKCGLRPKRTQQHTT